MDTQSLLPILDHLFNSGLGLGVIWLLLVLLFFWLASKFNPFQEKWRQWEGSIITAIKLAEKAIPNDTPETPGSPPGNKGLAKLDTALRFVLQAYADANRGKAPPEQLTEQLKQAIQIKHDEMDRQGALGK